MGQQKFCRECDHIKGCREVYRRLGDTEGPSVVNRVIIAFLLPLLVFIGFLAGFGRIFHSVAASFLLALTATFGVILIIRALSGRSFKRR